MLARRLRSAASEGVQQHVLSGSYALNSAATTYSYTITYGLPESPNRTVVVGIVAGSNANRAVSAVSVGGIAATRITNAVYNPNVTSSYSSAEWWMAVVPTGASGTVSYTYSGGSPTRTASVAYCVQSSSTPLNLIGTASRTSSGSLSANVSHTGLCLAIAYQFDSSTFTWSGIFSDGSFEIGSNRYVAFASYPAYLVRLAGTPRTMSLNFGANEFMVVQLVSLG